MSNKWVIKSSVLEQQESISGTLKSQRSSKSVKSEDGENKIFNKRSRDVEVSLPGVWKCRFLARFQSHKWTVCVRGTTNEDLSAVVIVFQLHSSFNNPVRVVDAPPFEVSEAGWGEFDIAITLHFHADVCDKPMSLYHHLKLYPEDDSGSMSTKKNGCGGDL